MISVRSGNQNQVIQATGTILQSLEQHNVEHVSHCKSGFCGACRMKLKSGSVTYVADPIGFHREGEILPCVCIPDGEVEVEC